ncbi:helix-turn-helix transcriptional regulator [Lactobacillus sp. ESL0679]|uniref:helix-turn-helix domain-containing protein n=1 Tax=Lactobacillus sp. ESL0679 TaxID=2983209 RepID=UPI0023F7D382|nr:helix-turn-helix transcriptional regulator [Lactobacillus sp. ESL0679]
MALLDTVKIMAKKHGYSLTELNEKAGLGKNTIYSWKTKTPSTENLQKVAKVLHTSTDYLLGNTDDPSPVSKDHHAVDIENDELLSYRGRPIPEDYLNIIKNLMDSDIQHGRKR